METITKCIDVECPVSTAYNQWTQFEEFPRFMEGVEEVHQIDDTHLHWKVRIAGVTREWDAEIYEQVPDQIVAWRSLGEVKHDGVVQFEPVENGTRVTVKMTYEPGGLIEKLGDSFGMVERRVQHDLECFKEFLEEQHHETGGWRGSVEHGQARHGESRTEREKIPRSQRFK